MKKKRKIIINEEMFLIETTLFTLFNTFIIINILMAFFVILSKNDALLLKTHPNIFMFVIGIILIRLVFPIEISFYSKPLDSYYVFPSIIEILNKKISLDMFLIKEMEVSLITILAGFSFSISIFLIIRHIFSYIYFSYLLKNIPHTDNKNIILCLNELQAESKKAEPIRVIVSSAVPTPMEYGFFKKTILLPETDYEYNELKFILSHEINHFKNKTNWIKLFISLLSYLMWWNPIIYIFQKAISEILEFSCDINVVENFSSDKKLEYLGCLINAEKRAKKQNKTPVFVNSFVKYNNKSLTQRRFNLVFYTDKSNKFISTCILAIFVFLYILSYRFIFQAAYFPPEEELNSADLLKSPELHDENTYILEADGLYYIYYGDTIIFQLEEITENFKSLPIKNNIGGNANE